MSVGSNNGEGPLWLEQSKGQGWQVIAKRDLQLNHVGISWLF